MGRIESLFQRTKRQASYNIMEPLNVPESLDQSSLRDLVNKFSQQTGKIRHFYVIRYKSLPKIELNCNVYNFTGNFPSIASRRSDMNHNPVDFSRPVVIPIPTDYPPISRGLSSSASSYPSFHNPPTNTLSMNTNSNANNIGRRGDGYYSSGVNYPPQNSYQPQPNRGRSLSMDYVDVDMFPSPGSSRMISGSSGGHSYNSNANNQWGSLPPPIEGSFYEWRKIMSDCSVSCGSGRFL